MECPSVVVVVVVVGLVGVVLVAVVLVVVLLAVLVVVVKGAEQGRHEFLDSRKRVELEPKWRG